MAAAISSGTIHERGFAQVRNQAVAEEHHQKFDFAPLVEELRANFSTRETYSYEFRLQQLQALRRMVAERQKEILAAVAKDLGRHDMEGFLGEIGPTMGEVDFALANLKTWMATESVPTPLTVQPGRSYVHKQPKGVVLVVSPWNYPIHLCLTPLISAIAAGCAAVIKPSEMTPASEQLLCEVIPQYLDQRFYRVVKGATHETTALLKERWDHIFYTGNGAVGRVVLRAAAEHLTPVTLELGGKSPAYVAEDCNLQVAARRILGTKLLNVGQTCVAPDYVLVHNSIKDQLVAELKRNVKAWYGSDIKNSESLSRIVNERHFDRIAGMLAEQHGGKVVEGGLPTADRKDKFIPPTFIVDPSLTSRFMQEEIFGPVLPIIGVGGLKEAVKIINDREHSLASYIFTSDQAKVSEFIKHTQSGGSCVNDCLFHITNPELSFGGRGPSGMGAYHGKSGFEEFTHFRSVLEHDTWLDPSKRYPTYDNADLAMLTRVFVGPLIPDHVKLGLKVGAAGLVAAMVMRSRM